MYADVSDDQFSLVEGSVIHMPTGAEFTPTSRSAESLTVWTGFIERKTPDGLIFRYGDVLAAVKFYWLASTAERLAEVA